MRGHTRFIMPIVACLAYAGALPAAEATIHGTVSQGFLKSTVYNYLTSDTRNGTYSFNEAIINISSNVDDRTRVGVQFLGRDLGAEGNNTFILDWGFGDYRLNNALGFRVGKIKAPLALYNTTRDVDAVRTAVLMPQSVYSEALRSLATAFQGGSVYGIIDAGSGASLEYEIYGGTIEMNNSAGMLRNAIETISGAAPILSLDSEAKNFYGIALEANTPIEGLRVGYFAGRLEFMTSASLALGLQDPWLIILEGEGKQLQALSIEFLRNNLSLAAEYQRMRFDYALKNLPYPDGSGGFVPITVNRVENRGGWYMQGAYRLSDRLECGSYYSVIYPDWDDKDGTTKAMDFQGWQKDKAFTLRFDITDTWICKAEMHLIDGTGDLEASRNPEGFPTRSWKLFAFKSSFYF